MNKNIEKPKKEVSFEIVKTPEIIVKDEGGAQLLSLILKAKNPEWGDIENPLVKETKKYFTTNPLDPNISEFLDKIRALQDGGVDEEALYILALTFKHPERTKKAFEQLAEHKSYIKNPQELQQKVLEAIESFSHSFSSSPLAEKLKNAAEGDEIYRLIDFQETKNKIEKLIQFFKPDSATTPIRKISLMPTDPLRRKNSGAAFVFGDELVLMTHIENKDNLDHEFLHSIINPIVDKLTEHLTGEQGKKISLMANIQLKRDYGEKYHSLLCEELIRTFNDVFKKGEAPQKYEDFKQKISQISEKQFQEFLLKKENFREKCAEVGIKTLDDFKNKSQEYFEKFEKNQLRDLIFELYQEYSNQSKNENINFERFILEQLPTKI